MADWTPQSRAEEILFDTINGEPYDGLPQSRIEELLLELKDVIESGGGGGGGTDNYNSLKNLPQINGTTLKGNKTSTDLGLPSVEANPTGEAVGELTSIDINGSKYSIPESSEYEETTVWTGSKDMLTSFTVNITDPYTDYDALRFEYESGNASHDFATHYEKLISKDTLATPEWFSLSDFYLPNGAGVNTVGKFTDTTNLSVKLISVNWFTSCTLTKIVGIKYGNGVSSGGGGGEYTTTVLFTNGASGDTTFQLSSAYTNFDAIAIHYSHFDGQDSYEDVRTYPTTFLNSVSSTDKILGLTNDIWYYYFSVYSTTEFRYVKSNAGYITDIIGIKYGSNSGGGGTDDYNSLKNLPQINGITLKGNKTSSDLGLVDEDDELTTAQMSALIALLD